MIFFGHLGISVLAAQGINLVFRERARNNPDRRTSPLDLRAVAVLSILPDLIDKPLALLMGEEFGYHTRLFGHSLLMAAMIFFLLVLFRLRHRWILLAIYLGHLVVDQVTGVMSRLFSSAWGPRTDDVCRAALLTLWKPKIPAAPANLCAQARSSSRVPDDVES